LTSKSLPEKKQIETDHRSGKGFKEASKAFDISNSTLQKLVHMWRKFKPSGSMPSSGRPDWKLKNMYFQSLRTVRENPLQKVAGPEAGAAEDSQ
uniref:Uncharacterized protein n=1 Tax=Cyprinodon variegatus TaxID=28743 RepID=A0A3Q2DLS4_CYPVA